MRVRRKATPLSIQYTRYTNCGGGCNFGLTVCIIAQLLVELIMGWGDLREGRECTDVDRHRIGNMARKLDGKFMYAKNLWREINPLMILGTNGCLGFYQ